MNKFFIAILLIISSSLAQAETYFVEEARGVGIPDSDKNAVEELVRIAVTKGSENKVADKREEAKYLLSPNLLKLGDSYVLSLQKKDKNGQVIFGDKMKATSMSDMDTVAARLTQAVIEQRSLEETADVTNITQDETTRNSRRYNATRQWTIGIGPGWSSNLGSSGGGFTFLLGYIWGLDPDYSIKLGMNIHNGRDTDSSSFSDFSLGGEYYLQRSKFSPFVGVSMGYGTGITDESCTNSLFNNCKEDRASGWDGTLTAGYKLFRTSTVNAAVMANYTYIFDETSLGNPSLFSVLFAVYY